MAERSARERFGMAALRRLGPERAHRAALWALRRGLAGPPAAAPDPLTRTRLWGIDFPTPVGVAAGFDKNAEAPDALLALGAGFVEVGAVTPRPQAGNPRPRLFRLTEDAAVINRMGFNNDGLARIAQRLAARRGVSGVLGVNIGANKDSADRMADYETVLRGLFGLADFFTVNVSSPNTEKLRDLQGKAALETLLRRVLATRDVLAADAPKGGSKPPVLVKIAPDLSDEDLADVAAVTRSTPIDGIIATNTTLARPETLRSRRAGERGGLSGAPLRARSTAVVRALYRETGGTAPIIGVGGIDGPDAAYEKIRAGASLVQLYTAMVYAGPRLLTEIAQGLAERLRADGFESVAAAVGADA